MNILALEFSSPQRSVAVAAEGKIQGMAAEQGGRETKAFALITEALKQAGLQRQDIACVAVGVGPGSYAGIRIAVAIAQGWNLARGVKLLGISSADAVAAQERARGARGELELWIDAQRGEFFRATYELGERNWTARQPFALAAPTQRGGRALRIDAIAAPDWECVLPSAAAVGELATQREDFVAATDLAPIYLRKAEFVKAPPPRFS